MGMIVGMVAGGLIAMIALLVAKKKGVPAMVEEDERTELIKVRAGNLTCWAVSGFSFVGWVTDNVLRHLKDLPVAFFSPWSIIFFALVLIYVLAWYYESRKVSDNEAAPDDNEMKKMNQALLPMGMSVIVFSSVLITAGDRLDRSVMWFLAGFELLLVCLIGILLGRMYRHRRRKNA
jgi:MFS family permease